MNSAAGYYGVTVTLILAANAAGYGIVRVRITLMLNKLAGYL
jgi:uncharacterized membrane protein